ncbi:hypothetical protein KL942_004120 [Ogataea angusta]|uniref:Centromere protein S n=1 Tax=Pichia angusta TaxID=870730 RepID=A0ABQ7RSZ3_PICAN|nr:hypothetical protein KL942_004120 [Ogataea angusta]KAG7847158.1 hypothetical protein KL940_003904 [Ogataea angusta]
MRVLTSEEKEIATVSIGRKSDLTVQHLKASIWYSVSKMVEEETKKLSEDSGTDITATPRFTAALVELVYRQLTDVGEDLELFAKHARRKTIIPEDLLMVSRKNNALRDILKECLESLDAEGNLATVVADTRRQPVSDSDDPFSDLSQS